MLNEYFTAEQIEVLFVLMCASSLLTLLFAETFRFLIKFAEIISDKIVEVLSRKSRKERGV